MRIKLVITSLIAVGSIIGGGYMIGTTAYQDGLMAGITAVVEQCASQHSTIYNGKTGDVMVCDGGHIAPGDSEPSRPLSEAPSPMPNAGQPQKQQDGFYEQNGKENISYEGG